MHSSDEISCQNVYQSDYSFDLYCESSNFTTQQAASTNVTMMTVSSEEIVNDDKYQKSEECVTSLGGERITHHLNTTTDNINSASSKLTIHVLDFNHISGSIYIDFAHIPLANNDHTLYINLVARQFLTFKLINIPTATRHKYRFLVKKISKIQKIKIFLKFICFCQDKWTMFSRGLFE